MLYNQLSPFPSFPWGTTMVQTHAQCWGETHMQTTLKPSHVGGRVGGMTQAVPWNTAEERTFAGAKVQSKERKG